MHPPGPPNAKELSSPPSTAVRWKITRVRGKRAKAGFVVARTWFEARALAMAKLGVEPYEVELEMAEPPR